MNDFYKPEIPAALEAVIGRAIIQWSRTEQAIEELIWHFLGLPISEGRVITSPLDAKYKISMLRGLGIQRIKGNRIKDFHTVIKRLRSLYEHRSTMAHGVGYDAR
jgi:hypothetical protein